jgi:hypothetical protein
VGIASERRLATAVREAAHPIICKRELTTAYFPGRARPEQIAVEETMATGQVEPNGTPDHVRELEDERKKLRRLQIMIDMVMSVIAQDPNLSLEEASQMANDAKRAALAMFPDKELAFDLIYKPRLQRLMRERYRII